MEDWNVHGEKCKGNKPDNDCHHRASNQRSLRNALSVPSSKCYLSAFETGAALCEEMGTF